VPDLEPTSEIVLAGNCSAVWERLERWELRIVKKESVLYKVFVEYVAGRLKSF